MRIPTLDTPRLQLIGPDESHLDGYAAMYGDAESMQHIRGGQTFDRSGSWLKIATHVGHWQLRGYGFWSVREKASGEIVGQAGLMYPADNPALEIGWLVERRHWGKGYASEAAQAALDHAFQVVRAERVMAQIAPANTASRALARKLGMREDVERAAGGDFVYWAER
ncbi:GNAT family N-acetyltransferase [Chitinimonas arctica]|uniref:GNAT family N-acetyltransferase n=1 Tax=Chitinimonas arctica TaxID=2594795 RepID=A0A516SG29_9NEIS|nr:GNAT family N-acetyltransferase [Chitinimonas arctica]QDQ27119.1 GNAT family N-acetyltransferase [Chitinimonas arctica]